MLTAAACAAFLVGVTPGFARSRTTNEPAIFTVKVTITDHSIVLSQRHAARGSTVTFILTNRGRKVHTFAIGAAKAGYSQGFARTLKPNQQLRIVMYLDVRAVLKYYNRTGKKPIATGSFRIT
ncbi:MAG: hypothetical protein ACRDL2_14740 [Gaiellaceae bacterium]